MDNTTRKRIKAVASRIDRTPSLINSRD
ncbi:hypothetical protein [Klebsiella sp. BIGb0407]